MMLQTRFISLLILALSSNSIFAANLDDKPIPTSCPTIESIQQLSASYGMDYVVKALNDDFWLAGFNQQELGTNAKWDVVINVHAKNISHAIAVATNMLVGLVSVGQLEGPLSKETYHGKWVCTYMTAYGYGIDAWSDTDFSFVNQVEVHGDSHSNTSQLGKFKQFIKN